MLTVFDKDVAWALDLAHMAHQGYTYSGSYGTEPYINHVERVLVRTLQMTDWNTETMWASNYLVVACLHDALEDTDLAAEAIRQYFSDMVYEAVLAITRRKQSESYFQYIERVLKNKIARKVKEADLLENLDNVYRLPAGHSKKALKERYCRALAMFV